VSQFEIPAALFDGASASIASAISDQSIDGVADDVGGRFSPFGPLDQNPIRLTESTGISGCGLGTYGRGAEQRGERATSNSTDANYMKVCLATAAQMRRVPCVYNTDQVNRDLIRFPASVLMKGDHDHHRECLSRGVGAGMPSHMQHDMHRLVGWSRPIGLYADGEMVRAIGFFEEPESEQEKSDLEARAAEYWELFHREGTEPYRDELISRIAPSDLSEARFIQIEAVAVQRPRIAAELYPELFTPGLDSVDKDGLVDYRALLKRMAQVQPGLFHDPKRDLLLFAHRFFRRSLSH
jgi:hypothetical protein